MNSVIANRFDLPDIMFSDKILDTIAWGMNIDGFYSETYNRFFHPTRVLTLEGVIRSAKSSTAVIIFHLRVQRQTAPFALIAAKDTDSIKDNILESKFGLLKMFPDQYKLKRDEIGGYYVQVIGKDIHILLAGDADKSRWEKILGKDIETALIDEANIADDQFIKEVFARQGATLHPITIYTLNGDDPNHPLYQERINKSIIIGNAPASIIAEMNAPQNIVQSGKHVEAIIKKEGYYYTHWLFDDNPALNSKQKRALKTLYPAGSFYHKTRCLGERGKHGKMIFADYMTIDLLQPLNAVDEKNIPLYPISKYAIGFDVAENRAANVLALIGFYGKGTNYERAYLVDLLVFKSNESPTMSGYNYKTFMLNAFLQRHIGKPIEGVFVDSAEGNYIKDLQSLKLSIPIAPSYKATIKERIDLLIILYSAKRFLFNSMAESKCVMAYSAYQSSIWTPGKEGTEREDNNLPMNDIMDAVEYGITRHMNALLLSAKKKVA